MALGMLLWSSGGRRRVRMHRSCSEATGKALGMLLWSSGGLAPGRKLGSHSHRLARRGACGSRVHMARKPWPAWGLQGEGVDQGQGGFTGILSRGERLSARKAGSSESSYPSPCEGTAPRPSVRGQAPRPSSRGTPYSALARIYAQRRQQTARSTELFAPRGQHCSAT